MRSLIPDLSCFVACSWRTAVLLAALAASAPARAGDATGQIRLVLGETGVAFEVPGHCVTREGPGTAEAVCDLDGSDEASRQMSAAAAMFFEVTVQPFGPFPTGASPEAISQRYAFADFQKDLPGAVCGEERISRIRIESPLRNVADERVTYSATITCPEVKFVGLGPRRAVVRYILTDGLRVNVMARSLLADAERAKPFVDAFLASVVLQSEGRR